MLNKGPIKEKTTKKKKKRDNVDFSFGEENG